LRKALLETALPFFQKLVEQESSDPELRGSRGQAYHRLASLRFQMGDRENAVADYRRALEILEPLAAEFPAVPQYRQDLASSHVDYGYALARLGQRAEAEDLFREAISLQEQLVAEFPTELQHREDLARGHSGLGGLLSSNSDGLGVSYTGDLTDESQAQFRKALALYEKLAADFPTVARYHRDVAGTLHNLAGLIGKSGKGTEAVALYEQAIRHQELALARDPKDPRSRQFLTYHHNNLAETFERLGRWAEVADQQGKALGACPTIPGQVIPSIDQSVRDEPTREQWRPRRIPTPR